MPAKTVRFPAALLGIMLAAGCSLFSTRPVQDMSDTAAALRAARDVQADVLAPELYRQAGEWFFKAKHEYKFKNFELARNYAAKARAFAEDAEFEALRNGGNRTSDATQTDPMAPGLNSPNTQPAPTPTETPYDYPTPTGIPAEEGAPSTTTPGTTPAPGPTT
jgi:hypothetical protein